MMRFLVMLIAALSFPPVVEGKEISFKTNTVQRLFFEMSADRLELPCSTNGQIVLGIKNNTPWYIAIDSTDVVSNVGYKLFDEEIRSCMPPEVADFIERYFLEIALCAPSKVGDKLKSDRVSFLSNRIPVPAELLQPVAFTLRQDEDGYSAEWNAGEKHHAMMFFPASFELILGAGQIEMENRMMIDILQESGEYVSSFEHNLVPLEKDNRILRTAPIETYCIESLSDCRYYRLNEQDSIPIPVFDSEKLEESVPNMLLLDCYDDLDIQITQSLYGFKTVSYTVKLGQWQNYCARNHLKAYVGIESIKDNQTVKALLIARNEPAGYNHVLSLVISKDVLDGMSNTIDAVLNGYIPTHNILSLY